MLLADDKDMAEIKAEKLQPQESVESVDEFELFRSRAYSVFGASSCSYKNQQLYYRTKNVSSTPGITSDNESLPKCRTSLSHTPSENIVNQPSPRKDALQVVTDMTSTLNLSPRMPAHRSLSGNMTRKSQQDKNKSILGRRQSLPWGNTLTVSPNSRRASATSSMSTTPATRPRSRSYSLKKARRTKEISPSRFRPRTCSMPAGPHYAAIQKLRQMAESDQGVLAEDEGPYQRVRSFSISSKGIINQGDAIRSIKEAPSQMSLDSARSDSGLEDFRSRASSMNSEASVHSAKSDDSNLAAFKVLIVGSPDVGKTSLAQQFMTSEYLGDVDTENEDETERSVSVMLDSEEATMNFVDVSSEEDHNSYGEGDAYVVVYSVCDMDSFRCAIKLMSRIRKEDKKVAVILVANKNDMVRNRSVSEEDGKEMAVKYDCKYIEVSVVLNHKVDELLGGLLNQILLHSKGKQKSRGISCLPTDQESCVNKAARGVFGKLFSRNKLMFRSCDNLMVL